MKVIYLAAGQSRRMGRKKVSMLFSGEALGLMALRTILRVPETYMYVVVHAQDDLQWLAKDVKQQLFAGRGELVVCENAQLGQSYSLIAGVKKAAEHNADKVMICLADQPFVTMDMIQTIMTESLADDEKYIACLHNGVIKPPVLLSSLLFHQIYRLNGDTGARKILQETGVKGKLVKFSDDELFADIDTIADYIKYCSLLEGRIK